ncbi:selenoneine biosynthesis selenosugar synthase SenB [Caenimonas sp. SL110]|uniref:selenoneine biosynthesis selenosugar synthase SenB n=1 Tax=Caenimonas sp. SL110 TaxID=1450524 RepID=UPI0006548A66|nr:selenoneine biosynthesis selenosugar synthase SenB [Caenimonas sp. SL110]
MRSPSIVIVSPALADANNGNWQTAARWQQLLQPTHRVRITQEWPDEDAAGDDLMLALHARRSAQAIQAWADRRGPHGLAVVLTGTDLYGDIAFDPTAKRSLDLAQRLVVLQSLGIAALPEVVQHKARVIYQSTASVAPLAKPRHQLRAVMVGHLRQVKSPQTLFEAACLINADAGIAIDHIGDAIDAPLGEQARATQSRAPHYRWLGGMAHDDVRRAIAQAHVLVHTSAVEGGAHVVMEAICSGTPVLASRIDGNVGLLGEDYEGYFEHGNAAQLAALLMRCRAEQAGASPDGLLTRLTAQCARRAHLFTPQAERMSLLQLLDEL